MSKQMNEHIDVSTIGLDAVPVRPAPLPSCKPIQSYWLATSEPVPEAVQDGPTALPHKTDIVIIGSGITGISTALHLSHTFPQNTRITILEARQFCSGATGRNGGHLTPLSALAYGDLAANPAHLARFLPTFKAISTDEVVRQILAFEARTVEQILEVVRGHEKEVEYVAGGNWHICFHTEEVEAFEKSLKDAKAAGLQDYASKVRRVPMDEVNKTMRDPRGVVAVYEIPGNTLHPRKLVELLWNKTRERAKRRNIAVELFAQSAVTQVDEVSKPGAAGYRAKIHVGDRSVLARYVIHATNAYVSHLAPHLAGPLGVTPTRAQVLAVQPGRTPTATAATSASASASASASPSSSPSSDGAERENVGESEEGWSLIERYHQVGAERTPPSSSWRRSEEMLWPMGLSAGGGYEYGHQRPGLSHVVDDVGGSLGKVRRPLFVLGGGREVAKGREWGVADDAAINWTVSDFLRRWLSQTLPTDYADPSVVQEWTGIMGYTMSKDPFVGPMPSPSSLPAVTAVKGGQYLSAGYSGHGMTRAFLCAEVVASMVVAEEQGRRWDVPEWFPRCYLSVQPPNAQHVA